MSITIVSFAEDQRLPIELYSSIGASSVRLAEGQGSAYVYAVHFAPGGQIGPHPAGFDQLFLAVQGSGWVAGTDGIRHSISTHHGAFVPTGEIHSKGSETGMLAIMIQSSHFTLPSAESEASQSSEARESLKSH